MRKRDGYYEYIAVYVDDLAIALSNPKEFVEELEALGYKLKGVGTIAFHLGSDYKRDEDGVLMCMPKKYIYKSLDVFKNLFGEEPRPYSTPLEKNDHPEIDESEECNDEERGKYQTLCGILQWMVFLGRFDIFSATMTMSRFRVAPRKGHIDRLKRIFGYLKKFDSGSIRFRTDKPDYSDLPKQEYDWSYTVYGYVKVMISSLVGP